MIHKNYIYLIVFVIILVFTKSHFINAQEDSLVNSYDYKIDSTLNYYFELLDSAYKEKSFYDSNPELFLEMLKKDSTSILTDNLDFAINFMQRITGINAPTNAAKSSYVWTYNLTPKLINKWKRWFDENRSRLIWEKNKCRINRSDKDIYSGKLKKR